MNENEISAIVVDSCFKIHNNIGSGLLESVYEEILCHELKKQDLKIEKQVPMPFTYEEIRFEIGFRADIIINNKVIVELKSGEKVLPLHKKQLLTYLKITGCKLGLLINFNDTLIKNGITRIVNNL